MDNPTEEPKKRRKKKKVKSVTNDETELSITEIEPIQNTLDEAVQNMTVQDSEQAPAAEVDKPTEGEEGAEKVRKKVKRRSRSRIPGTDMTQVVDVIDENAGNELAK